MLLQFCWSSSSTYINIGVLRIKPPTSKEKWRMYFVTKMTNWGSAPTSVYAKKSLTWNIHVSSSHRNHYHNTITHPILKSYLKVVQLLFHDAVATSVPPSPGYVEKANVSMQQCSAVCNGHRFRNSRKSKYFQKEVSIWPEVTHTTRQPGAIHIFTR